MAGPLWRGRPTRVFAWMALPTRGPGPWPGVVLVHGGGGTASREWVRYWAERGYAAIAPDLCGCLPEGGFNSHPRHPDGGPPGCGGFDQIAEPLSDQWAFHACAAVIQARAVLMNSGQVDPQRIGVTGNSWGGVITCLAAAAQPDFAWLAPVYGCGFLHDSSWIVPDLNAMGQRRETWIQAWDPSSHLARIRQRSLWITGSNDFAFPVASWERSLRLPATPAIRSLHLRLHHADGDEIRPLEVPIFAAAVCAGGTDLAAVGAQERSGRRVTVHFRSQVPLVRAELLVAMDREPWDRRAWNMIPAHVSAEVATGVLPGRATAFCMALTDARGAVVCGPVEELPA